MGPMLIWQNLHKTSLMLIYAYQSGGGMAMGGKG